MESLERKQLEDEQAKALEKLQKKEKALPNVSNISPELENNAMEEEFKSEYIDTDVLRSLPKENKKFYKELYKVIEAADVLTVNNLRSSLQFWMPDIHWNAEVSIQKPKFKECQEKKK